MDICLREKCFKILAGQNKEAWDYINTGQWEPHTFQILDYFVKKNDVVIDLGCWSGVISLYLSHIAKKIYAIDPDPVCFKELQTNISLNPVLAQRISYHQMAISDKKGTIKLSARESYGKSSSSILSRNRDTETSFNVSTQSLMDFVTENQVQQVDFIKIDIEGAEFIVLPTLETFLLKMNYPTLYISFHYYHLLEHVYNKIFTSKTINKSLLKIDQITGLTLFSKNMNEIILEAFSYLKAYQYIYTSNGTSIDIGFLKKHPKFIKDNDLVFTNQKWN